jgi:hypothetical protein
LLHNKSSGTKEGNPSIQIGKLVTHELDLWENLYKGLESYLAKVLVIKGALITLKKLCIGSHKNLNLHIILENEQDCA